MARFDSEALHGVLGAAQGAPSFTTERAAAVWIGGAIVFLFLMRRVVLRPLIA